MFMFRGVRNVLWKSNMCSRNPPGLCACQIALVVARCEFWHGPHSPLNTLCVLDRSRCGAVMILADSLGSWERDLMDSLECPSMTGFMVHNIGRSWPRSRNEILSDVLAWSCTGPYQKMLWRSCWHPLRGSCMILRRPLWENLVEILINSL